MIIVCTILVIAAMAYGIFVMRTTASSLEKRMEQLAGELRSPSGPPCPANDRLASWERLRTNNCPVFSPAALLDKMATIEKAREALEREWKSSGYAGPEEADVRKLKNKGTSKEEAIERALRQDGELAGFENNSLLQAAMINANLAALRGSQTIEEAAAEVMTLEERLNGREERQRREERVRRLIAIVYG